MALGFRIELEFGNVGFLRRGENRRTRRKTSRSKDENQQQTQPTYDTGTGNRTRATLVGGERSHHCAIPAPPKLLIEVGQSLVNWKESALDLFVWRVRSKPTDSTLKEPFQGDFARSHTKCSWNTKRNISNEFLQGEQTIISFSMIFASFKQRT